MPLGSLKANPVSSAWVHKGKGVIPSVSFNMPVMQQHFIVRFEMSRIDLPCSPIRFQTAIG